MGALFKKIVFVVLFAVLPTSCGIRDTKASNEGSSPIVVMAYYVPEKEYAPENLPLDQLTHIIFSFTQVIDGEMKFRNKRTGEKLRRMVAQRDKHPDLKIMVACGGWGADGFSDMAHTAGNRYKFVQSAVDFIEHYQLDGLDIDWEYPAIPAANTGARPEDKQNFTLLMTELREALNTLDRKQTLTFASAGWEPYYGNVELLKVMEQVDFMNVMTYDQIGGKSPYTGHHTALGHISEKDIQGTPAAAFVQKRREAMKNQNLSYGPRSAEKIVDYCLDNGVDPQKIVIGAAFY
ncbi:MAG: glycosyl hydrolase family 18 protein, partial [Bacteroidota bacterium]